MPSSDQLSILFEQDRWIVINKPSGIPSTGRDLDDPNCAQALLIARERRMVWAVHQLDAQTSGVNIFVTRKSKVATAADRLSRGVKHYLAFCHGVPPFRKKRLESPMGWIPQLRRQGITPQGKVAISEMTCLDANVDTNASLLRVSIQTGRTHQIRVHAASLGLPLLGEGLYATPKCQRHSRHALHAAKITLRDGTIFSAPLPEDLRQLAERLRLRCDIK